VWGGFPCRGPLLLARRGYFALENEENYLPIKVFPGSGTAMSKVAAVLPYLTAIELLLVIFDRLTPKMSILLESMNPH